MSQTRKSWCGRLGALFFSGVVLAGCDLPNASSLPPWPAWEAVLAFDTQQVEGEPATKIMNAMLTELGMIRVCGDIPLPSVPPFNRPGLARIVYLDIQDKSYDEVLAAVERLHPGDPRNRGSAETIWHRMLESFLTKGYATAQAQGCAALKPAADAVMRMFAAWPVTYPRDLDGR
jgi:hypothetical protein